MTRRSLLFLTLLATLLAISPAAAQNGGLAAYCGDLPEDDCQRLRDASATVPSSGSFITQFYVATAGAEMADDTADVTFAATIEGDFARVDDGSPVTASNNMVAALEMLDFRGTVSLLAADHTPTETSDMTAEATPEATEAVNQDMDDLAMREIFYGEVALANGLLFINADTLRLRNQTSDGMADAEMTGWVSTSLPGLLAPHLETERSTLDADLMAAYQGGIHLRSRFSEAEFADYVDVLLYEPQDEAIAELFGQDVVVYTTVFDAAGFLSDPANRAIVTGQMGAATLADADESLNAMNSGNVRFVEYVGLDDGLIHRVELIVNNVMVEASEDDTQQVDLVFITEYRDLNAVDLVAVPETATELAPQDFYQQAGVTLGLADDMAGFGVLTTDNGDALMPEETAEAMTDDTVTQPSDVSTDEAPAAPAEGDTEGADTSEPTAEPANDELSSDIQPTIEPLVVDEESIDLEVDPEATAVPVIGG